MFVRIYNPATGKYLGRTGIEEHTKPLKYGTPPWYTGSKDGKTGLYPYYRINAFDTRKSWHQVRSFVEHTGFVAEVSVNQAESNALGSHGIVNRYGSSQSYVLRPDGETL